MARLIRDALVSIRDLWISAGPFVLIALLLLGGAYWLLDPTPPRRVTMITGPDQSAFETFGRRYREALRRHGIELELRPSPGSLANLRALGDPASGVSFGFVQGGTTSYEEAEVDGLESLGSLFYEPVWIFHRDQALSKLKAARGPLPFASLTQLTIALGPEDSGVPRLFSRLAQANRLEAGAFQLRTLEPTPAVVELLDGRVDAVVFATASESPLVQMLLQTPGIRLFDFAQAEAYARRLGFLSHVVLPQGIVDLSGNLPATDVHLIAPTATLVARRDAHPALMQLMVQAAAEIHGQAGWFQRAGQFPSPEYNEIPVADEATRFYRNGRPLLQRYLPFWLANVVERMWVVLAAIIAVLIPLSRIVPPIYAFRVRSRIFRWYGRLRSIEDRLAAKDPDRDRLKSELDELDDKVAHITVPLSYADELYALRAHIGMVRRRLG